MCWWIVISVGFLSGVASGWDVPLFPVRHIGHTCHCLGIFVCKERGLLVLDCCSILLWVLVFEFCWELWWGISIQCFWGCGPASCVYLWAFVWMQVCCEPVGGGIGIYSLWICFKLIALLGMMGALLFAVDNVRWCFESLLWFCQLKSSVGLVRIGLLLLLRCCLGVLWSMSRMVWFCLLCLWGRSALWHQFLTQRCVCIGVVVVLVTVFFSY